MSIQRTIFTYTGTIQIFTIPSGVSSINIYCWGAGGGSSKINGNNNKSGVGGTGGFVKATINISSISSLAIIVGEGGKKGLGNSLSGNAFGGGGTGHAGNSEWFIGGGGGLSGVFINDNNANIINKYQINTNAKCILIAGGGGSGGANHTIYSIANNHGGNGGGNVANNSSGEGAAIGGSSYAGGTGSGGATNGSKYLGGNAIIFSGGGGGGWYGGATLNNNGSGRVGGGGGGSSFINEELFSTTDIINLKNNTNGTNIVPGNTEVYYQSGIGVGGINNNGILSNGGNGLVVIEYNQLSSSSYEYSTDDISTTLINYEINKFPNIYPDIINNVSGSINNYSQTFSIKGNNHTVNFSSYNYDFINATPLYLFDCNTNNLFNEKNINYNNGGYFGHTKENIYDFKTCVYKGKCSFNNISGEWVSITFPYQFNLKKYSFIARNSLINRAPGKWILYVNNNNNIIEIDRNDILLTDTDYYNEKLYYNKSILKNNIISNTYIFVFTHLAKSDFNNYNDNNLNFIEILLFGINSI